MKKLFALICSFLLVVSVLPDHSFAASTHFDASPIQNYIKTHKGIVGLYYYDTVTNDSFSYQPNAVTLAASTIKLPLVTYIMEQASKHKIDLNKKLTYYSYEYNGGSGIIQYKKAGTQYTIGQLVQYAVEYSDNIAFVMLRNYVGQSKFIAYCHSIGGKHVYTNGVNVTTANDLADYMKHYLAFSKTNKLGPTLDHYLTHTIYNDYIPKGLPKGTVVAHKVGMIPMDAIYNDVAYVKDKNPYILIVLTHDKNGPTTIQGATKLVHQQHLKADAPKISAPLKASQVQITNNADQPDLITLTGISKGDAITLYKTVDKKSLITQQTSSGDSLTITVQQIGSTAGTLYVTIKHPGMTESTPVGVAYLGETSQP